MNLNFRKFAIAFADGSAPPRDLDDESIRIGRLASCDICLDHKAVSRIHAGVNFADSNFTLVNLSTSNVLSLNGRVLPSQKSDVLADGDTIQIGPFAIEVERIEDTLLLTVQRAVTAFGTADILHNNVGHAGMGGPIELSETQWLREIDINLNSMFRTTKAVLPIMLKQKRGVITNISSSAGIRYTGYPYASYYASKGAVNQFTVGLAIQYARDGIRCNAILPGLMDTPLIYAQIAGQYASKEDMQAARHAATPTGRMGTGWDVAHAAVVLASDEASYINAVCLPVDGGLTARCV